MSSKTIAQLKISAVEIRCETPYNVAFVDELKRTFTFPDRQWDPDDKVWILALRHEQALIALCREHFDSVQILRLNRASAGTPRRPASTAVQTPFDVLYVKPTAPVEVVAAAYRALARKYHPDVCDSADAHQRMLELNSAYESIGRAE
jgi:hypothetical protein